MTTWTLDHKTYNYYSTIGDLVVWGYPEDGDEVVINDNFSYIFKPSSIMNKVVYTNNNGRIDGYTMHHATYTYPNNDTPTISESFEGISEMEISNMVDRLTDEETINEIVDDPEYHAALLQAATRMIVGNIEPGREETELEVYMREANQFR